MLIVHVAQWREHDDLTLELAAIAEKIKESETHDEKADNDARNFTENGGKIVDDPVETTLEKGDNVKRVEGKTGENVGEKVLEILDSAVQSADELGPTAFINKIIINGIRLAINLNGNEGQGHKDNDSNHNETDQSGNGTVFPSFRQNFDHSFMKRSEYNGKDGGQDERRQKRQKYQKHQHHDRQEQAEEKV
jgi:hypothetical protein